MARTYGLLNDPALPAYVPVPNGAGGNPEWSTKTFNEMTADIITWMAALRTQSGDTIDPNTASLVMGLATSSVDQMATVNDLGGTSVMSWLKQTYSNVRVVSVPEFDGANGGDNVAYLYAETTESDSTDDGRTFTQVVPARFQSLGVEQSIKHYTEDYTNAMAGILLKRPFAVYRASGI